MNLYSYVYHKRTIIIEDGIIYARKFSGIKQFKESETLLDEGKQEKLILDLLNIEASDAKRTRVKKITDFITDYGLLDNNIEFPHKNHKVIDGYISIAYVSDYVELSKEIKSVKYDLLKLLNFDEIESDFEVDSVDYLLEYENVLESQIENINDYLKKINIVLSCDPHYKLVRKFQFPSLRHLIYYKLSEMLIGERMPVLCEGCHNIWFSWKADKKYCSKCSAKERKKSFNKNLDTSQKEKNKVYSRVCDHFRNAAVGKLTPGMNLRQHTYISELLIPNTSHNGFVFDIWREQALEIKQHSNNFYEELDALCKKSCTCKKCSAGIASRFKAEYEQKIK